MQEKGLIPGLERSPREGNSNSTHSSILAWEILWTEEPCGLQSMGSQRLRHDLVIKQQQQLTAFSCSSWQLSCLILTGSSQFLFPYYSDLPFYQQPSSFLQRHYNFAYILNSWSSRLESLSHHLFLQGNSLVLFIGSGSPASSFYLGKTVVFCGFNGLL